MFPKRILFLIAWMLVLSACTAPAPVATVAPTLAAMPAATAVPAATVAPTMTVAPTATVAPTMTAVPATIAPTQTPAALTDPFAYCAAVGNIDTPDARYTGPAMPDVIPNGLNKAMGTSMPLEILSKQSFWRCMDRKVYACAVGANLPCEEKADASKAPSAAMADFCKANPNSDFIPAVVTGRATVYEWKCVSGAATIVKQLVQPDARGFHSDIWYVINPG
ncbi:MAG: hypothetical protein WCF84_00120 [Anaerolineae bacterium]